MTFTSDHIKELATIVRQLSDDDILISAVPKTIRNNGEDHSAVDYMVTHRATMKYRRGMFRDNLSNFSSTIKREKDRLVDDIHKEIVEEAAKKPTNTL